MVALEEIKADLPDWPDDVIEQWLLYHANSPETGWPPPEPFGASRWSLLLNRPWSWWQGVHWTEAQSPLTLDTLCKDDQITQVEMADAYFGGKRNSYSQIESGPRRVFNVMQHLREEGLLPRPIVALETNGGGLTAVDGSHRLCALQCYRGVPVSVLQQKGWHPPLDLQPLWLGEHETGELFR